MLPSIAHKGKSQIVEPDDPDAKSELLVLLRSIETNTDPKKVEPPGELELGSFDAFLWMPTELETGDITNITRETLVPIGAYGEEFTRKLIMATKILLTLADELSVDKAAELAQKAKGVLKRVTARGRDQKDWFDLGTGDTRGTTRSHR